MQVPDTGVKHTHPECTLRTLSIQDGTDIAKLILNEYLLLQLPIHLVFRKDHVIAS